MVATGSRVGFMTSLDGKTPGAVSAAEGYFDDIDDIAEPDFVDQEGDDTDDEEVSRLARQKGFGLGGLVDRLVGFSLFNVEEDAEEVLTAVTGRVQPSRLRDDEVWAEENSR